MQDLKLHFRTFVHATEDPERVTDALLYVMAVDEEPEGASRLEPSQVKGHHGNDIHVLEAKLGKDRDIARSLGRLRTEAPAVAGRIADELDERLDEDEGSVRWRFDKQEAVQRRLRLTRGGDAIQVELRIPRIPGRDLASAARELLLAKSTNV